MKRLLIIALLALSISRGAHAQGRLLIELAEDALAERLEGIVLRRDARGFELRMRNSDVSRKFLDDLSIGERKVGRSSIVARLSDEQAARFARRVRVTNEPVFVTTHAARQLRIDPDVALVGGIETAADAEAFLARNKARTIVTKDLVSFRTLDAAAPAADRLVILQRSDDLRGIRALSRPIKKVIVQSEIPRDGPEYHKLYGREPNAKQLAQLDSANHQLERLRPKRDLTAAQMRTQIEQLRAGDVYVVIGHSRDGVLHLTTGDPDNLVRIAELTEVRTEGQVVVVTCNSLRAIHTRGAVLFATDTPIPLTEGVTIVNTLAPATGTPPATLGAAQKAISKLGGVVTLGGIALVAIEMTQRDTKEQHD